MVSLVLLATLSAHDPPQAIDPGSLSDSSRTQQTTEVRQESTGVRSVQVSPEGGLLRSRETILGGMLIDQRDPARNRAAIDSLLSVHPEIKGLVLRALLMPKPPAGYFASSPPSVSDAWRIAGNSRMTPFEKSGLIKSRQMELHDTWTEGRILAPQMDMVGTVFWLLEILK